MKLKRLGRLSEGLHFEGAFGVGFKTLYAFTVCGVFFYTLFEKSMYSASLVSLCDVYL